MNDNKYFFLKLNASRPTFAFDMTDEEKEIMNRHVAYLADLMNKGMIITFGPVFDPQGPFGIAIVKAASEEQVQEIIRNDPAAEINRYEYHPMKAVVPAQ
jgi:uncharacterized protein